MNTPNPLVPQGTAPAGGKSTVRIAVLTILVVHVALIGGMLIQGCSKQTPKTASEDPAATAMSSTNEPYYPTDTNVQPVAGTDAVASATSTPVTSNVPPLGATPVSPVAAPVASPLAAPIASPIAPVATTASAGEYVVAAGDKLASIAKNHGVSLKALQAANPTVDPRKMRVGQKLQIPAASASAAAPTAAAAPVSASVDSTVAATEGSSSVYTVKAGDALGRIAKTHHTTIKAIMAANNLKSQNIRVGQKLKLPAAKKAAAPAVPATTEPAPISTASTAPAPSPLTPVAN